MASENHRCEVEGLRVAAAGLPWGYARTELLEEAARVADGHRDLALGYAVRLDLIDAARYSLRYDLFAAAFAWCFAVAQRHPDHFPAARVLGYYQYVIGNLANFAHVSRGQYDGLYDDAARHFAAAGYSQRTLLTERRSAAIDYADPEMARLADAQIARHPRDGLTMPPQMETVRDVEYALYREDDAAALAVVDRHFADARRGNWADLWVGNLAILPLARAGRAAEAEQAQERRHKHFESGGGYGWSWGNHLSYCGATGKLARGADMLRRQLPVAMSHADTLTRFYCLSHAVVLLDALAAAGDGPLPLPPVPGSPWSGAGVGASDVAPATARDWAVEAVAAIAAEFDRRNGNGYYADLAARRRAGLI